MNEEWAKALHEAAHVVVADLAELPIVRVVLGDESGVTLGKWVRYGPLSDHNRTLLTDEIRFFLAGPTVDEGTGYNESSHQTADRDAASERALELVGGDKDAARQLLEKMSSETKPLVDQHMERIERVATKLRVDRDWSSEQVREVLSEVK